MKYCMCYDRHLAPPTKNKEVKGNRSQKERLKHTISSPGRHVSQRSPSKRISFERGIRPGGTVPGLSWIDIL